MSVGHADPGGDGSVDVVMSREGQALFWPTAMRKLSGEPLEVVAELQDIARDLAQLQKHLGEVVQEGRQAGLSWDSIGWCIGTTGEAVRQRFGPPPAPKTGPVRKPRKRSR